MPPDTEPLPSWNDTGTRQAIVDFVEAVTRERQPWQAASTRDYGWLGQVITRHYQGDDRELPVVAAGNSNGDLPMLHFAGGRPRPGLRLLVRHDDPEREFDYVAGSERALEEAGARDWTVISIKRDWASVFDPGRTGSGP